MPLKQLNQNKAFTGWHKQYQHYSPALECNMRFAIFLPEKTTQPAPVLYWLSGLTCTDENFMHKAGALRHAAELGIAIVAPDTSPRGKEVPDDPSYALGQGAGFYLNATQKPWVHNYRMYDYVNRELPALVEANFPVSNKKAIAGHSMGGHGALTIGLKNPEKYCAISAFSPICNPMRCPWGKRAFTAYLGDKIVDWQQYDASKLLQSVQDPLPILVDQGDADEFLTTELKPETLIVAAQSSNSKVRVRMQPGYDHSYYFIASFIDEHLDFHATHLGLVSI